MLQQKAGLSARMQRERVSPQIKKKKATAKISLLKLLVNQVLSAIGSSVCSSLPDSLRDPVIGGNSLRQSLFATY